MKLQIIINISILIWGTFINVKDTNHLYKISDFDQMDYYLFCDTAINEEVTDIVHVYGIYGGAIDEVAEGEQLYQKYKGKEDITYISPDGLWTITEKRIGEGQRQQTLYYDGKEQRQVTDDYSWMPPFIVKDENGYREIEEETYQKIAKIKDISYEKGYYGMPLTDESGQWIAGIKSSYGADMPPLLSVWNIDNQEIEATFSLTDMNKTYVDILQFYGDGREGKIIFCHGRDFYELNYPSGDIHLLGKDMYCLSYSPDGKYIAYSSVFLEGIYDLQLEESEKVESIPPGIYVLEVETGKTAYIEWDMETNDLNGREFHWIDKDVVDQWDIVYEEGLYAPVLEEYRRVIENTAYVEADWKYVYDYVKRYIGESSEYLYYSTKDLINDGTPELILGIKEDKEYRPFIIYTYNNGKIEWLCISEAYKYYRSNKSNEYEEITEEEFLNIRSHYTAEKEVLDWKKVKEF